MLVHNVVGSCAWFQNIAALCDGRENIQEVVDYPKCEGGRIADSTGPEPKHPTPADYRSQLRSYVVLFPSPPNNLRTPQFNQGRTVTTR